jgi:hypothetical protein
MCLYMHLYLCKCIFVNIHVYMCMCIYILICTFTCNLNVRIHTCTHIFLFTSSHTSSHILCHILSYILSHVSSYILIGFSDVLTGVLHSWRLSRSLPRNKHVTFSLASHFLLLGELWCVWCGVVWCGVMLWCVM